MTDFFYVIATFFQDVFDRIFFNMEIPVDGLVSTSVGALFIVATIISFCISVFWKGAHK